MASKDACANCGQRFRTASGQRWHQKNMHPAITIKLLTRDDAEYAAMSKGERYRYESTLVKALAHQCGQCGKPAAEQYCVKCTAQNARHLKGSRSADADRERMDAIRPRSIIQESYREPLNDYAMAGA